MDDAILTALCLDNVELSPDVLASLLTTRTPAQMGAVLHKINTSLRFAGPSAIACARSHPTRAKIIASRTTDIDVQRALLDLEGPEFNDVLVAMAKSALVSDPEILREVHDRFYGADRGYVTGTVLERVDLDHAMNCMDRDLMLYGKDLEVLARRVARHVGATNDVSVGRRFLSACDRSLGNDGLAYTSDSHHVSGALGWFAKELVESEATAHMSALLEGVGRATAFVVVFTAWREAPVIDEYVASAALGRVDPDKFTAEQRSMIERSRSDIPQYPQEFRRSDLRCTDSAWRLIAAAWPGLLLEPVSHLENDDPQMGLLVELALASRRSDLAVQMLDRRYHPKGKRSGPVLDAKQYRTAASNAVSGVHTAGYEQHQPCISGAVAVSHVPSGVSSSDVLSVWMEHSIPDIVHTLSDAQHAHWHVWEPTLDEFNHMIDRCSPHESRRIAYESMNPYGLNEKRPSPEAFKRSRPYLDAVVARVPASSLMEGHGSIAYVTVRLNEAFGSDRDRWLSAWNLAEKASVPLDAVINAATRIG